MSSTRIWGGIICIDGPRRNNGIVVPATWNGVVNFSVFHRSLQSVQLAVASPLASFKRNSVLSNKCVSLVGFFVACFATDGVLRAAESVYLFFFLLFLYIVCLLICFVVDVTLEKPVLSVAASCLNIFSLTLVIVLSIQDYIVFRDITTDIFYLGHVSGIEYLNWRS